ncbi:putative Fungal-specific transcription factor domain-containing protein [Seiridium cardinale]
MRDRGRSGLPRFTGSGSGIHFIRTIYDVLARSALGSRPVDRNNVRGDLVPGEDDELVDPVPEHVETPGTRSRAPFWRQDEIVEDTSEGAPPVNFDNLVQWAKSYFANWHPAFSFLHGPRVLAILEKVASVGITNISEADATVVRSMVSISLAIHGRWMLTRQLSRLALCFSTRSI